VTALPVVVYPSLLAAAVLRAGFGLLIAWWFWARPGRGIAIVGTVLGLGSIPLAFLAVTNVSTVGPFYLLVSLISLACFVASAYCWRVIRKPALTR
jgi:hypothetical protein